MRSVELPLDGADEAATGAELGVGAAAGFADGGGACDAGAAGFAAAGAGGAAEAFAGAEAAAEPAPSITATTVWIGTVWPSGILISWSTPGGGGRDFGVHFVGGNFKKGFVAFDLITLVFSATW